MEIQNYAQLGNVLIYKLPKADPKPPVRNPIDTKPIKPLIQDEASGVRINILI